MPRESVVFPFLALDKYRYNKVSPRIEAGWGFGGVCRLGAIVRVIPGGANVTLVGDRNLTI